MTERVRFGESSGVLALPDGDVRAPGVVVIHEWWGVNDQIERIAQHWASEGFVALAPDLFHGKVARDAAEAQALMAELDFTNAVHEIAGAVAFLRGHARCTGKVAVTGYCMGGALSFATACAVKGLAAVVPYYGLPPSGDWARVDAPIQAHFAEHDDWATVAGAKQIAAALPTAMELHTYDAKHAFCNDKRPEVYDDGATRLSWSRAVAFVRQHAA